MNRRSPGTVCPPVPSETPESNPAILLSLCRCAGGIADHYGIPDRGVLIHGLSIASALASIFVSSEAAGPAILPLLVQTPGVPPPDWMGTEWHALERLDDMGHNPSILDHPARKASQRHRARLQAMIDPSTMFADMFFGRLASQRLRFGRAVITTGTGRLATVANSQPLTHLSASLPRVRAVFRRLSAGPDSERLIGCVDPQEFKKLVSDHGLQLAQRAGLVLRMPRALADDRSKPTPTLITDLLHRIFVSVAQSRAPYVLRADPKVMEIMDAHALKRQALVRCLPEAIKSLVPNPDRVWHMTALLASLCHANVHPRATHLAAEIATDLDEWAALQHVDVLRLAFPADHQGLFIDTDLAVFRQLGDDPQTIREIQRSLRGINKHQCLPALQRAVAAGLAVELPGKLYRLVPSIMDKLSETGGEKPAHSHSGSPEAPKFTENTEKSPPPPPTPIPTPIP